MQSFGLIFSRTVRDSWKTVLAIGGGLFLMGALVASMYPLVAENIEVFAPLLENPMVKALAGSVEDMSTPAGFIGIKYLAMMPLFLGAYGVYFGLQMVRGEESRGTLDILLSTPVPRWRLPVEKGLALVVNLVIITTLGAAGLIFGIAILNDPTLSVGNVIPAMVMLMLTVLLTAALTLVLSTLLKSTSQAAGVAAAIIVGSYFVVTFADAIRPSVLDTVRYASFFNYYDGAGLLLHGMLWRDFAIIAAVTAVLFAAGLWLFQRRDLTG